MFVDFDELLCGLCLCPVLVACRLCPVPVADPIAHAPFVDWLVLVGAGW